MIGTCKENGSGSNAKKDEGRKTLHWQKRGRLRLRWMDDVVADLKVMKIKQWMKKMKNRSNGDWLLKTPKLAEGCSTERMDVWMECQEKCMWLNVP